jgi:hypothetical protein
VEVKAGIDERIASLEAVVRGQALELLRTRLELNFYKALIATRRWGSPGGNDKAIEALDAALVDLDRAQLPDAMADGRAALRAAVIEYREGLRRLRVTATATNQTRLYRTFDGFVEQLMALVPAEPGRAA